MIKRKDFESLFKKLDKRLLPSIPCTKSVIDGLIPTVCYSIDTQHNGRLQITIWDFDKHNKTNHFYGIATIEKYQFESLPLDVQLFIANEGLHYNRNNGKLMFFARTAQDMYSQLMRYTKGYFDFEI